MWDSWVILWGEIKGQRINYCPSFLMKAIPYNLVFIQLSKVPIYNASIKFWQ